MVGNNKIYYENWARLTNISEIHFSMYTCHIWGKLPKGKMLLSERNLLVEFLIERQIMQPQAWSWNIQAQGKGQKREEISFWGSKERTDQQNSWRSQGGLTRHVISVYKANITYLVLMMWQAKADHGFFLQNLLQCHLRIKATFNGMI